MLCYYRAMKHKPQSLWEVRNLTEFSRKSGLPLRTLQRIKAAGESYPMAAGTRIAINRALARYTQEKV